MSHYSAFARYYDELTANINYKKRAEYFNEIIKKFKTTQGNILLDLACGTGSISEEMAKLGYDVIGVDNSDEMLGIALNKKFDSNLPIQYLCQDMRQLDMYGTIDVTICALDSLNHLENINDVKEVLKKVSLFAEPNGLFIFDVNTIYKHREVLANNTFTYETNNVYCIWENSLDSETNNVKINLEFFELMDNGLYERSSDNFIETAFSIKTIETLLIDSGFKVLAVYGDDTFDSVKNDTLRAVFVARKIY